MDVLKIGKLIKTRSKEIEELKVAIRSFNGNRLIFQKLPRYMRRRQMSWNPKRLPKLLQSAHKQQIQKSWTSNTKNVTRKKRPRRLFRRRSKNLTAAYRKRQKKSRWLETHVWHAKRFHMVERWGYKIANSSYEKTFRRCYRNSDRGCLIQDISFYNCFELCGSDDILCRNLDSLTHKDVNRLISDEHYKSGYQRGSVILYEPDKYPYNAIGPITFMWIPTDNHIKKLWFWVHPAFRKNIIDILRKIFHLNTETLDNKQNNVTLIDLQLQMNMFRLTGSKSLKILQNMMQLPHFNNTSDWFKKTVVDNSQNFDVFEKQVEQWSEICKFELPTQLCNNRVINLTIINPKYIRNNAENSLKTTTNNSSEASFIIPKYILSKDIDESEASNPPKRMKIEFKKEPLNINKYVNGFFNDRVKDSSIVTYKNTQCENRLVPGEFYDVKKSAEVVPVLLIQRPGNRIRRYKHIGYGSGFDLLIPEYWGRTFWHCLHLWKASSCGLQTANMVTFEMGQVSNFAPDYLVGKQELKSIGERLRDEYFKRPPKCRINYRKLGILMPFTVNWLTLINDWKNNINDNISNYFVLRDKVLLEKINNCLNKLKQNKTMVQVTIPEANNCLIPVRLTFKNCKGTLSRLSIICLPIKDDQDLELVKESNHRDYNETKRKIARKEHQRLLKKYRRIRIKAIQKKKTIPTDNRVEIANYKTQNECMWIDNETEITEIRHSCNREIMGFVEYGNFSLLFGYGSAIGYITANSLLLLLRNGKILNNGLVLVRDKHSTRYRQCYIETIPLDIIL